MEVRMEVRMEALTPEILEQAPSELALPHLMAADLIQLPAGMHEESYGVPREAMPWLWRQRRKQVEFLAQTSQRLSDWLSANGHVFAGVTQSLATVEVVRAQSWEPGKGLVPAGHVSWHHLALAFGDRAIREFSKSLEEGSECRRLCANWKTDAQLREDLSIAKSEDGGVEQWLEFGKEQFQDFTHRQLELRFACSLEQLQAYQALFPVSSMAWRDAEMLMPRLQQEFMRAWATWFPPERKFKTYGELSAEERERAKAKSLFRTSKDDRSPEERNLAVEEYLAEHGPRDKKVTLDELAEALGCSPQAAMRTPAWDSYNTEWEERYGKCRTRKGKGRRPNVATDLTDEEVRRLAEEQAIDDSDKVGRYDHI